ncbi:LysR substrate-binding domain-containing protein [uncultured Shimia sp.]|uniref:LysR substrate-binding domain-containing protein n=1 Tax=uncultured Shimia sp. TaxID=573152 RepID=UPI002630046C|nr:LysR substrate-binding domain-containing protein [uncultured Shimia sp.]
MHVPRRFLPPLPWLSAFESVARLESVTEAAVELDLTQGAVSRQIQKLEDQLDVALFHREKRRLTVTPAGRAYAVEVQKALSGVANATLALKANPEGGLLELAILPAFGAHWLAPRLPTFLAEYPGVTLNLATRTAPFEFAIDQFHAAIHFGQDDWPGTQSLKLMDEEVVPVAAPSICGGVLTMGQLKTLPLLQLQTRSWAWQQWFERQGQNYRPSKGIAFDQFATMLQATVFGAGAALMPRYLVEADLAKGTLVSDPNASRTSLGAYYLVWPDALNDHPPIVALRTWAADQVSKASA